MASIVDEIDIPADEITPDTVAKGMIIRLHPKEVIWKTSSEKIDLNALNGKVYLEIKPGSLDETDIKQVYNGLRTGRLLSVKKIVKTEVPSIEMNFDSNAPVAWRLLDLKDDEFQSTVMKFKRVNVLELAYKLEKQNKKREDRLNLIQKQIALVANK